MNAYLADAFTFQPARQVEQGTVFSWIKRRLEARQARKAERRELAYLRTLDSHLLDDMGVDRDGLYQALPIFGRLNPHVIAFNVFTSSHGRPIP
jgi:hypothetical protein